MAKKSPATDAPEQTPDEAYREKFNVLAIRAERQFSAMKRLANSRKATPSPETQEKAIQWLDRQVSEVKAAINGLKVPKNASGPL